MSSIQELKQKTALVTGSSSGLGLVLAEGLAKAGARVVLNGRDAERLEKVVTDFESKGFDVAGQQFDITDSEDVVEGIAQIKDKHGGIDILVNNAGMQYRAPLEKFPLEAWDRIIRTNLTGAFVVSRAVVQGMISMKRGKIINILSLQAELGRQTIAPYAASKGGLKMLTRAMCVEWAQYNIQVNAIGPGYFATEMTRPLREDANFDNWLRNRTPAGRWGDPTELVAPLLLFASSGSDFINGQVLFVDGGIIAAI